MKSSLKSILNIPFLFCLGMLLFNDFYLKAEFHNWFTGKLSDFCGLAVFVMFWAAVFPSQKREIYFSTALVFVFWKSPFSQSFIDFFSHNIYSIHRVVDFSDLIALVVLPILYFWNIQQKFRLHPIPIALVTLFSFCATSYMQPHIEFDHVQYLLFNTDMSVDINKSSGGITCINQDSLFIVKIEGIDIDEEPKLNDRFFQSKILKNLDLHFLRIHEGGIYSNENYNHFSDQRDSLSIHGYTFVTLKLDSCTEYLNFYGTRLHGVFQRYSNSNKLIIDGRYKNGIEDSIWTYYGLNQSLQSKKHFINGEVVKEEIYIDSILKSENDIEVRQDVITTKRFVLAFLGVLICLALVLIINNKKDEFSESFELKIWQKIGWLILAPFLVVIVVNILLAMVPNPNEVFFILFFVEVFYVYIITMFLFFIIIFIIKLRKRYDLILFVLLFSLVKIFIGEFVYLNEII